MYAFYAVYEIPNDRGKRLDNSNSKLFLNHSVNLVHVHLAVKNGYKLWMLPIKGSCLVVKINHKPEEGQYGS